MDSPVSLHVPFEQSLDTLVLAVRTNIGSAVLPGAPKLLFTSFPVCLELPQGYPQDVFPLGSPNLLDMLSSCMLQL
jgi:hypothetical protein